MTKEKAEHKDRYLEFTISGAYYNSRKELVDFDNVVGRIPMCNEDQGVGSMHVRGRFWRRWVKEATDPKTGELRYPQSIFKKHTVHIDDVKEVRDTLPFIGKDLKELSVEEMQHLAVAKDLRFIPRPDQPLDLRTRRIRTYAAYSEKILRKTVKWQDENFNFSKLPSVILTDRSTRRDDAKKISNEKMIEMEQENASTEKQEYTLDELKRLADENEIQYPDDVEYSDLYSALFSG